MIFAYSGSFCWVAQPINHKIAQLLHSNLKLFIIFVLTSIKLITHSFSVLDRKVLESRCLIQLAFYVFMYVGVHAKACVHFHFKRMYIFSLDGVVHLLS